jgi:23S rRNA (guanosine2251-2'-O)-methyltransferase
MPQISVIIHDIRSTHNVGSILRTCDGFGISTVYIGGISPYPLVEGDTRLPHISQKLTKDIAKTALGAEASADIVLYDDLVSLLAGLKNSGVSLLALEQSRGSENIHTFDKPTGDIALLLGREVEGIDDQFLKLCDHSLEIPMRGKKESFNVSVAAGIALYALCLAR